MAGVKERGSDNLKICIFILSVLCNLSCIGEYYQDEMDKTKGNKIAREDAKKLLTTDLLALQQRCPQFGTSGYNWMNSYLFMLISDPCPTSSGNSSSSSKSTKSSSSSSRSSGQGNSSLTGCADYSYLDRGAIATCRMLVQGDPCTPVSCSYCNESTATANYRFAAFADCGSAFKSNYVFPLFL
ncbi:hypothetical protein EHO60_09925 [Leptospira fletcheri]|uniref:Uncharacterized protein n=1 Tax=Leptospira fletcheri TaxID=2484981 RepID=A0A4R9GG32_9LEPT|nr:hypothetical protein [Leptospira fletcheri]TGK10163.1 hypothetical protein EHO60_09925 [Leptospira fletcheri]